MTPRPGGLGRLWRLELRRTAMVWTLPVIAGLFWLIVYRPAVATSPLWTVRAMGLQTIGVSLFAPIVVGVAAWTGAREHRHRLVDLVGGTARSRWARQLAAWVGLTGWAVAAYLGGVAVLYAVTLSQGAWGAPLWWPVAVGAASVPAFSALGYVCGVLRPSRFTAPLAAIAVFFVLEISVQFIHGDRSALQISPLVTGPWNLGPDRGLASVYPYLPDLPIAQLLALGGLTATLLGGLGVGPGSAGPWPRRLAAVVTIVGLLVTVGAVGLAGTGHVDRRGLIAIALLHNDNDDAPVPYRAVCSDTAIPVCVHPVYAADLPVMAAALRPVLAQVAGLPGAPVRITQAVLRYTVAGGNGIVVSTDGPLWTGSPPELRIFLPVQGPGPTLTGDALAARTRTDTAPVIVTAVIATGRTLTSAQQAVLGAILGHTDATDPAVTAAVRRFAALAPDVRHQWLAGHVDALRAGTLTLEQLP